MLTRCPGCNTTFRVISAQLKARAGKVRCGQCHFVFNALDTLVDDEDDFISESPSLVSAHEGYSTEAVFDEIVTRAPLAEPSFETDPAESTEIDLDMTSIAANDVVADGIPYIEIEPGQINTTEVNTQSENYSSDVVDDYLSDPFLQTQTTSIRRWQWQWVAGSVVAATCLLLQAIYYYRVDIAALHPELRPLLQTACNPFHCDVPRPRLIETLGIDASDLHPNPLQPGHLTLSATLRSKAVHAQEWPMLELTLTDYADQKLAVKDFAAKDYLPKDKNNPTTMAAGFPANGEVVIELPLDVGDLPAAGYRLYVFYP